MMSTAAVKYESNVNVHDEALTLGKLAYQLCNHCKSTQYLPRSHCARCHGDRLQWLYSSLRGHIHSFTIVSRAPTAEFRSKVPYMIALVDMEEGFRLMVNVLDCAPDAVEIGSEIRITFRPTADGKDSSASGAGTVNDELLTYDKLVPGQVLGTGCDCVQTELAD